MRPRFVAKKEGVPDLVTNMRAKKVGVPDLFPIWPKLPDLLRIGLGAAGAGPAGIWQ